MTLCPYCGVEVPQKGPCDSKVCLDNAAKIIYARRSKRGVPMVFKGRDPQPEHERIRKQHMFRLLPGVGLRIRAQAKREGINMCDLVERWALSLPPADE